MRGCVVCLLLLSEVQVQELPRRMDVRGVVGGGDENVSLDALVDGYW